MKPFFITLFLLISLQVFSQKIDENKEIFSKKFTYQTLSKYQKQLFDDFIEEQMPKESGLKLNENTTSRGIIRLASALLYRNEKGDVEKAVQIIKWIFTLQNLEEKSKDFAIWRASGKPTNNYDQNWREFIGTDLIIIYHNYRQKLPVEVQKELESCLIRTVKGAIMRNVNPDYNNISIMSSFMMEYIGTEFNIPEYKNAGLEKARAIYNNFLKYNTLCEYNSPTYYGVDFVGLALWRELSFSPEMKAMSNVLEKELWLDVATFYNANLQNICGPYLRAYGIDIKKAHAIISTWIAVAIDNPQIATIPGKEGTHHEREFIVPIVELGILIPEKALVQFKKFDNPRFITRTTSNYYEGDRLKKVTAYIEKDWMMGGLWGNRKVSHILKTGTMHWKAENGDIGWLFVPGEGKTNVRVNETKMQIFLADTLAKTFQIFVYEKNITSENFKKNTWKLPNMTLKIDTDLKNMKAEVLSQEMIDSEGVGTRDFPFVPGEGKTNVRVNETKMQIFLADTLAKTFQIFVYEKNITSENFKKNTWKLPNMTLKIDTDLKNMKAEVLSQEMIDSEGVGTRDFPFVMNVIFEIPANWDSTKPLIEITPKR